MVGTLHEDQYSFFIISPSFLLRMRNVSDKFVKKIKTPIFFGNFFDNRAVYEVMCEKYCRAGRELHAGYLRLQTHTHNM